MHQPLQNNNGGKPSLRHRKVKNLFYPCGPLHPVDHQKIIVRRPELRDRVVAGLLRGDYFTVAAPRQMGKTTFLWDIAASLPASARFIYIDVRPFCQATMREFYRTISKEIIMGYDSAQPVQTAMHGLFPIDPATFKEWLRRFAEGAREGVIILAFDGAESINLAYAPGFFASLSSLLTERYRFPDFRRLRVIVSGSEEVCNPANPGWIVGDLLTLPPFSREETEMLINRGSGLPWQPEAVELLYRVSGGHPHQVHRLAREVMEKARHGCNALITSELVAEAVGNLKSFSLLFYPEGDSGCAAVQETTKEGEGQPENFLVLDRERKEVWRDGKPLDLSKGQFLLFSALAENAGRVLNEEELYRAMWGGDWVEPGYVNVKSAVKRLRKSLGDTDRQIIQNRRGLGYVIPKGSVKIK